MKHLSAAASAAILLMTACGGTTSDRNTGDAGGAPHFSGPLYISAMQPDPSGVEAEGGQGWIELKVSDGAGLAGAWRVQSASGDDPAAQLISSEDLAAESWSLQDGAVIRLHPRAGYSAGDDRGSASYGYDGKYDFVCGSVGAPASLPGAGQGCVWIEDGEGNITDILFYGSLADLEMISSAVSCGEWPSGGDAVPCSGTAGYLRLSDASAEGEGPLAWEVSDDPSFVLEPHICVSEPTASPASVFRGETVTLCVRAEGFDGASITSVDFDFSSVAFDKAHAADAVCRTVSEGADHLYSYPLDTSGIVPGNCEIPVTVHGAGVQSEAMRLSITVKEKPVITLGMPSFSFAPSTCAAPGSVVALSVPSAASGTAVSAVRLVCAELGLDASAVPADDGIAVFTIDTKECAEGDYTLALSASGPDADDAASSVELSLRSDLCVAGGDMESAVEDPSGFKPSGTAYADASGSPGNVFSGERSLHVSGSASSNGFIFTSGSACMPKAGFSKIVFRLKGASAKSLSINVRTGASTYRVFNLGAVSVDKTVSSSGSNSYAGTIHAPEWAKISLDLSDVVPGGTIAFKFGSSAAYDLYVDDIRYE